GGGGWGVPGVDQAYAGLDGPPVDRFRFGFRLGFGPAAPAVAATWASAAVAALAAVAPIPACIADGRQDNGDREIAPGRVDDLGRGFIPGSRDDDLHPISLDGQVLESEG